MKHKYISTQSNELLSYFNGQKKVCFGYTEAFEALPNSKESTVRELLSDMTRRGLLMRLKESIYYIIPYEQNAETFMPDWHLIAEYIVKDAEHYIGYYSALQIHNLITQPSLKEQIVVSKPFNRHVVHKAGGLCAHGTNTGRTRRRSDQRNQINPGACDFGIKVGRFFWR